MNETSQLRELLSHVFLVPKLVKMVYNKGLLKERKNEIMSTQIPEVVALCLQEKSKIKNLSSIDPRLIPLVDECYDFIHLVQAKEETGYLAASLEEHVLPQINKILEVREMKEQMKELISPFFLYPELIQSEVQDTEKIKEIEKKMKKNKKELYELLKIS